MTQSETATNTRSKLMGAVRMLAMVGLVGFALTLGRSCGNANHDVPATSEGEVLWIATFNGL